MYRERLLSVKQIIVLLLPCSHLYKRVFKCKNRSEREGSARERERERENEIEREREIESERECLGERDCGRERVRT